MDKLKSIKKFPPKSIRVYVDIFARLINGITENNQNLKIEKRQTETK
jgi:hypothetical protein